jgi:hypothetical protein
MNPKPPVARTGMSGWLGRRSARLKSLVVVGAVSLGFAGVGFAAAGSATADPATNYVAVGSDTIQDVMNGFAGQVSDGILASYNATNPVTNATHEIITPSKVAATAGGQQVNCSFTRPNGSTEGFNALDFSSTNGGGGLTQLASSPGTGCIDISRSSAAPGINGSGAGSLDPGNGNLIYIPFALDAVTGATGPTTAAGDLLTTTQCLSGGSCSGGLVTFTPSLTNITTADDFTKADLVSLYSCAGGTGAAPNDFVAEGGIQYYPNGDAPTGVSTDVNIDLYLPQSGSGTLKFWASTLSFSATSPPNCDHQTILSGPAAGVAVEEHDGTAFASDPNGYGPLSIAQWLAQSHGIDDRRHDDVIHMVNGVNPLNAAGGLNTSFPIVREVYNVMQYDRVVSGDSNFDAILSGLFTTTSSSLCRSTVLIKTYGFGTLPSASTPDACGSTASSLRVQQTTNGPS